MANNQLKVHIQLILHPIHCMWDDYCNVSLIKEWIIIITFNGSYPGVVGGVCRTINAHNNKKKDNNNTKTYSSPSKSLFAILH